MKDQVQVNICQYLCKIVVFEDLTYQIMGILHETFFSLPITADFVFC